MTVKLEVGKTYETETGRKVRITDHFFLGTMDPYTSKD